MYYFFFFGEELTIFAHETKLHEISDEGVLPIGKQCPFCGTFTTSSSC